MERAMQFLREHKDVALATSEDNIPKLRIFQVMKQEGNVLYFATSEKKAVSIPATTRWSISVCLWRR